MTAALTSARNNVADALASVGAPVHRFPPSAVQPPAVVLLPGSPWIAPRGTVALEVVAYATAAGGDDSYTALEDLVEAIRNALWAAGLAPGDTGTPRVSDDAGVIEARTLMSIRTTCK
jgi:hypothetical protein